MLKLVFKMLKFVFKMLKLVLKTPKLLSPTFSLQGLGWMSHKKACLGKRNLTTTKNKRVVTKQKVTSMRFDNLPYLSGGGDLLVLLLKGLSGGGALRSGLLGLRDLSKGCSFLGWPLNLSLRSTPLGGPTSSPPRRPPPRSLDLDLGRPCLDPSSPLDLSQMEYG